MIVTELVAMLPRLLLSVLWTAYRRPLVLGSAILGFSISGLGMIIGSHAVTGWWQAALLGFGISLLVVGTVELGILGLIKKLTEPDDEASKVVRVVSTETVATLPQVAAILRDLANRLDASTAEIVPAIDNDRKVSGSLYGNAATVLVISMARRVRYKG